MLSLFLLSLLEMENQKKRSLFSHISHLKICSIKINELSNKLEDINTFIQNYKIDILCIQQTYKFPQRNINNWQNKHGYVIFTNSDISKRINPKHFRPGTCVLVKSSLTKDFNFSHTIIEKNRIQLIEMKGKGFKCQIINAYVLSNEIKRKTD